MVKTVKFCVIVTQNDGFQPENLILLENFHHFFRSGFERFLHENHRFFYENERDFYVKMGK